MIRSSERFLPLLILIFFGAIVLDAVVMLLGINKTAGRLFTVAITGIALVILLRTRLKYSDIDVVWAWLGLFSPVGFIFGLYLYFWDSEPTDGKQGSGRS